MNPKLKLFLTGIGLCGATTLWGIYYFWNEVVYLFPSAPKYIFLTALVIAVVLLIPAGYYVGIAWDWVWEAFLSEYFEKSTRAFIKVGRNQWFRPIRLTPEQRTHHVHVVGSTGVGKTEFLLNMIFQDIEQGHGLLLIEHKGDPDLYGQIAAKVMREGRNADFHFLSLVHPKKSYAYNPLNGESGHEIAERVFNSWGETQDFYKQLQFQWLASIADLLLGLGKRVTFKKLYECLTNENKLSYYLKQHKSKHGTSSLGLSIKNFLSEDKDFREKNLKGLEVYLSRFTTGEMADVFNTMDMSSYIDMNEALQKNEIIYLQLPTMGHYEMATTIGKLALQDFQSAVSDKLTRSDNRCFFSCYLDEFASLAYPGFTELISKARAANVGLVLSHQSISDLKNVSESFAGSVLSNTNTKVVFRCPDPSTAQYFSDSFGTRTVTYKTEQTDRSVSTGRASVREVEEYIIHPNQIKNFGVGEGVISRPTERKIAVEECKFSKVERLKPFSLTHATELEDGSWRIPREKVRHHPIQENDDAETGIKDTGVVQLKSKEKQHESPDHR